MICSCIGRGVRPYYSLVSGKKGIKDFFTLLLKRVGQVWKEAWLEIIFYSASTVTHRHTWSYSYPLKDLLPHYYQMNVKLTGVMKLIRKVRFLWVQIFQGILLLLVLLLWITTAREVLWRSDHHSCRWVNGYEAALSVRTQNLCTIGLWPSSAGLQAHV